MTVEEIAREYSIEIDDIRWYLSVMKANQLLEYRENPEELARQIWSKKLEDELYRFEEGFLSDLQEDLNRHIVDESKVREVFLEILAFRRKRTD
jgi:hypothetical protein